MSTWTSGYVADIGYTHGYYRELSPTNLALSALSAGSNSPSPNQALTYCELGCGQGFTANLLAAANPHIEFYANDFNPAHIVGARALAEQAGSANVHFSEGSFDQYADEADLPSFDVVVLHGIYSWISPENRGAIVDFIRRKLKPGGLVFISYNTMPGWAPAAPLRHLMQLYAGDLSGPTGGKIAPTLTFIDQLKAGDAAYFRANPAMADRVDRLKQMPHNYLAHEYLNADWTPFYHSDVVGELSQAKLVFLASANVLDHFHAVNLTTAHQQLLATIGSPALRETLRDFIVNQQFRRDLFAKGSIPLSLPESQRQWMEGRFALVTPRDDVPLKVSGALGEASLLEAIYNPVLDVLASGPKVFSQMLGLPQMAEVDFSGLREALTILIGAGHVQPCLDAAGDAQRARRVKCFNAAVLDRAVYSSDLQHLASPVTGGGIIVSRFSQLFLLAQERGHSDPVQFAWEALQSQGHRMLKHGKTLETANENLVELQALYEKLVDRQLPVLRHLGIA